MDIEEFYDDTEKEVRRPGSLLPAPGFVSSFPPLEGAPELPLWDDKDIRRAISDPNRRSIPKLLPYDKYCRNQRQYSSCNGFALGHGLTHVRKLRGVDDGWVGSGAYVYSKINGGVDNGSHLEAGLRIASTQGTCSYDTVPYDRIYPHLYSKSADAEALKNRGLECYRVKTKQGWRTALAAGWMGIAAVHADNRVVNYRGTGIVPLADGYGNHAILISDMRLLNGTEVYEETNSWGLSWGNRGRAWLTWEHFAQTFNNHTFYVIPGIRVQK